MYFDSQYYHDTIMGLSVKICLHFNHKSLTDKTTRLLNNNYYTYLMELTYYDLKVETANNDVRIFCNGNCCHATSAVAADTKTQQSSNTVSY